jgi:hypothetical protein
MYRTNKITLFVAARDTGKTTYTKQVIASHPKKVLIVDTEDHPMYREFELVDIERLKYWQKGTKRIITNLNRVKADAELLSAYLSNCLVIFEDATKYLCQNTPRNVFSLVYNSKQKNVDVFMIYHGFKNIPPELLSNIDYLTLGYVKENIKRYENKIPNFDIVYALHESLRKANQANPVTREGDNKQPLYAIHKTIQVN